MIALAKNLTFVSIYLFFREVTDTRKKNSWFIFYFPFVLFNLHRNMQNVKFKNERKKIITNENFFNLTQYLRIQQYLEEDKYNSKSLKNYFLSIYH